MNFKEYLQTAEQLQAEKALLEGAWVVKSKDGVEKRFKREDSPEAKAWSQTVAKKSMAKTPDEKAKEKELKASIEAQADKLLFGAILRIGEWTQLDWSDLFDMDAKPVLVKAVKKNPMAYPEKFVDAVKELEKHGSYDKLRPYLNRAIKNAKQGSSWDSYVRQMSASLD